jgi:hypothetical protein
VSGTGNNSQEQRTKIGSVAIVLTLAAIVIVLASPYLLQCLNRGLSDRVVCGTNLKGLAIAMKIYSHYYSVGKYPTADKWCDLLVQNDISTRKQFVCASARRKGNTGPSHYAINPNATPTSDPNVVLLFETKAGWNQFGGPEILTTEHHKGEGCLVGFTDGSVSFVKTEDVGKLRWTWDPNDG